MIGNCQAGGVARALEVLVRDADVTHLPMARLRRDFRSMDALAAHLAGFDRVFAQHFPPGFLPDGDPDALGALGERLTPYPAIVFGAFHPDMAYVGDLSSLAVAKLVRSPLGHYHSALALFAYLEGLDERRTVGLFRDAVFARLGYLDAWRSAAEALVAAGSAVGLDLGSDLLRWTRRGTFMHNFNHPKLFVLGDLARHLVAKAGLPAHEVRVEEYVRDDLAGDVVWPVHAPIAERYGVPAAELFKGKPGRGAAPPLYDLAGFVAGSFAIYRRHPPAELACPRVAAWRADPGLREALGAA